MTAKLGFSIKSLDNYQWPVDVKVPFINGNGEGDFEIHRFTGSFKHLSLSEANTLFQKLKDAAKASDAELDKTSEDYAMQVAGRISEYQIDLYMDIWQGWGNDLTDTDGTPLPYSTEMKRKLLEERIIREAVIEAHRQSQGGEKVRVGNSATSPVAGPAAGES